MESCTNDFGRHAHLRVSFLAFLHFSLAQVQIPKDFPQEYLYMGNGEDAEDEYWQKQDQLK